MRSNDFPADGSRRVAQRLPQLARRRRAEEVGRQPFAHPIDLLRMQQEQSQERRLGTCQRSLDGLRVQCAGRRHDRLEVDAAPRAVAARPQPGRRFAVRERLADDPLVDASPPGEQLDVAVAPHGVGDRAQRGHDRVDQLLATGDRLGVVSLCEPIDQELHDRLRGLGGAAPDLGVVADDLVGVPPVGQADHVRRR